MDSLTVSRATLFRTSISIQPQLDLALSQLASLTRDDMIDTCQPCPISTCLEDLGGRCDLSAWVRRVWSDRVSRHVGARNERTARNVWTRNEWPARNRRVGNKTTSTPATIALVLSDVLLHLSCVKVTPSRRPDCSLWRLPTDNHTLPDGAGLAVCRSRIRRCWARRVPPSESLGLIALGRRADCCRWWCETNEDTIPNNGNAIAVGGSALDVQHRCWGVGSPHFQPLVCRISSFIGRNESGRRRSNDAKVCLLPDFRNAAMGD